MRAERRRRVEDDYVEGLTGEEIIQDVLEQITARLRGDCNLRESDAYTGGYDGSIEIHLNLYGMDKVGVNTAIPLRSLQDPAKGLEKHAVDEKVHIPLETALNVVRERSGQQVPTLARGEDGRPAVKKRTYTRAAARGGNGK